MIAAKRPIGVTALSLFFYAGATMSSLSALSLLWQGGPLEPMWRINPRAREAFAGMGGWSVVLLSIVCVACAAAAIGLWRSRWWGHRIAVVVLCMNVVGDAANALFGREPLAAIGVPIAGALVAYLMSSGVRSHFVRSPVKTAA